MGTRDMSRWLFDYEQVKKTEPNVSIITCHDEFLLPTLLEASDGALIGFAGFVPELMVELVHAALDGDLAGRRRRRRWWHRWRALCTPSGSPALRPTSV